MTIPKLLFALFDTFPFFKAGGTLAALGRVHCETALSTVRRRAAAIRSAWLGFQTAVSRGRSERERYLAASVDQFDLERRERALCREQRRDSSLIGW